MFGVSACKRQKLKKVICATRAAANLGILLYKIGVLRQKLVIISATRDRIYTL